MNNFVYKYPIETYFGTGAVDEHLGKLLGKYGDTALLAYGGGSIKKNGIYQQITAILKQAGKTIIDFAGINALADFIKEVGLPTTLTEMGITDENILKAVADTSNITAGCCKKLERSEIFEILKECL